MSTTPHSSLEALIVRSWMRRGLLSWLLLPLAGLFYFLSQLRRGLYRLGIFKAQRLPAPVIVVGNIFIGGTGKTPFTIWLVQALREAGFTPGVISRGYGSEHAQARLVDMEAPAAQVGDEPLLIARRARCPVMVGRKRVETGLALLAAHPEVNIILSDDGLQHYALHRDIEIVLFDERGTGNGWVLPAGPLREPASRQRDFTVVNGAGPLAKQVRLAFARRPQCGQVFAMSLSGDVAECLSRPGQALPLERLQQLAPEGRAIRIVAAAGIGNPGRFFAMLRQSGLQFETMPLPDHYDFAENPFAELDADLILITEKDAVKCAQIEHIRNDPRLWVVPVAAQIDAELAQQIVEKCRGRTFA